MTRIAMRRGWFVAAWMLATTGCTPNLPEPESAGALLYSNRCSGCHRLFAPQSMTFDTWKFQVDRMQGEMARRGAPPLSAAETETLLAYLRRHAG